jgi:predicted SAM-dependent methyltransferase
MSLAARLPLSLKMPLRRVHRTSRRVFEIVQVPFRPLRQASSFVRLRSPREPLKLHLGCGRNRLRGFINIDLNWSAATDFRGDITQLPCPDGCVSRIETYHVIEHIPRPRVEDTLAEWHRVLSPGGVLVIECPDFRRNLEEVLAGNERMMYSIFGWQRFPGDAHHWGYTEETLSALLRTVGFTDVITLPAQDYHAQHEPCIRIEATK